MDLQLVATLIVVMVANITILSRAWRQIKFKAYADFNGVNTAIQWYLCDVVSEWNQNQVGYVDIVWFIWAHTAKYSNVN